MDWRVCFAHGRWWIHTCELCQQELQGVRYPDADERERAAEGDSDPGDCAGPPVGGYGKLIGGWRFPTAAMSADAGSIAATDTPTSRRTAFEVLGSMHKAEIKQAVGELLSETRNRPWLLLDGADGQIERVISAVLDA